MDTSRLKGRCENFQKDPTNYGFQKIVEEYIALYGENGLADLIQVPRPTIGRYIRGVSRPHPLIQQMMIGWILKAL